jgi:hypothetical protein
MKGNSLGGMAPDGADDKKKADEKVRLDTRAPARALRPPTRPVGRREEFWSPASCSEGVSMRRPWRACCLELAADHPS